MPISRARLFALVLLTAILAYWLGHRRASPSASLDPPAILIQTQRLKQLVTIRYTIQKVVGLREPRPALGEESILLIVQGRVLGGIDLNQLHPGDIHILAPGRISIKLPPAQVLEAFVEEKDTKVWDRKLTWWTPWSADKDLEGRARQAGLDAIKQAALDAGLLKEARRQAETAISELFKGQGITVEFEPNMSRLPAAALPHA